ncbi:Uncharacterized protein dnm_086300 [Desulfonema magnum]|uniref:Uncharacterized protein n=1 Tax=Desulfonema magnum TaxID=45655 RepID=A0A975GT22_9BACT|nr:Uncharacterized protein dnm_086300 [Desulfonema magnum]
MPEQTANLFRMTQPATAQNQVNYICHRGAKARSLFVFSSCLCVFAAKAAGRIT